MNKEEAIEVLKLVDENASCDDCLYYAQMEDCPTDEDCIIRQALKMAIQALSQEPCDDVVSREELLKAIDTWDKFGYTETGCFVREPKGDYVAYIHYDDVIKCIKGMSPVTQKPNFCVSCKHNIDNEICLECEYDGITRGMTRYESVTQKSGEWIPCSERLPEAFSFVNCTCHSLIDDRENWVVETCYLPQPPDSPYSDWGNIPMLNMGDCEVVAWMYRDIPKPYKVELRERSDKE